MKKKIFLSQDAESRMVELQGLVDRVNGLSRQMAVTFCEDRSKFKLEECLAIFKQFCDQIRQCQKV